MEVRVSNLCLWGTNVEKRVNRIKKAGVTAVELSPECMEDGFSYGNRDKMFAYKKELEESYGLKLAGLQAIWFDRKENLYGSKSMRDQLLNYSKWLIDLADELDCRSLLLRRTKHRCFTRDAREKPIFSFLCELGEYAFSRRVTIYIRPISDDVKNLYFGSVKRTGELIRDTKSRGLRLALNTAEMNDLKKELAIVDDYADLIGHVQITEPRPYRISKAAGYKKFSKILRDAGYQGDFTLEYQENWDDDRMKLAVDNIKELYFR